MYVTCTGFYMHSTLIPIKERLCNCIHIYLLAYTNLFVYVHSLVTQSSRLVFTIARKSILSAFTYGSATLDIEPLIRQHNGNSKAISIACVCACVHVCVCACVCACVCVTCLECVCHMFWSVSSGVI